LLAIFPLIYTKISFSQRPISSFGPVERCQRGGHQKDLLPSELHFSEMLRRQLTNVQIARKEVASRSEYRKRST
jgi:hypothetical protein